MITPTDIAAFAPDLDTSKFNAVTLSGIISQAEKRASQFCSVKGFDLQTETDLGRALIRNDGELHVTVQRKPIVSVTSVTLKKSAFNAPLTIVDPNTGTKYYHIPYPASKIVFPNSFLVLTGSYLAGASSNLISLKGIDPFCEIAYTGGYQTIPDDLKYAIILYVRDYIASKQTNPAGVAGFSQGSYSVQFGQTSGGKSALVQEAEGILTNGDYVRSEIF